jgi:myo-inositol-hexaphosphate 3-phosphohydrolase
MANPNIVNVATINGKTDVFALTTTETNLVTATANTVFKINTIMISNIDGTNAADVTIKYNDGSDDRAIASTINVPADSTLVVSDKNSSFYLEESEIIKGTASANSDLECLISYEIIAD